VEPGWRSLGLCLWKVYLIHGLFLSLILSDSCPPWGECINPLHSPCHESLPHHTWAQKQWSQLTIETFESLSQLSPSSLKLFSQVSCHSDKKLTHTSSGDLYFSRRPQNHRESRDIFIIWHLVPLTALPSPPAFHYLRWPWCWSGRKEKRADHALLTSSPQSLLPDLC
jgi:hypothetical protein